jgi:hypothetical protein
MTTSVVIDGKYKPRPDCAHYVENVYGGIDGKRTLKYSGDVDKHVCASCYVFDSVCVAISYGTPVHRGALNIGMLVL